MMKKFLFSLVLGVFLISCNSKENTSGENPNVDSIVTAIDTNKDSSYMTVNDTLVKDTTGYKIEEKEMKEK